MHSGVQRRCPTGWSWRTPSCFDFVNLHRGVSAARLRETGKRHYPSVAKHRGCRIPPSVSHASDVGESVRVRIEYRIPRLTVKRIILQRAAVDERTAIRQHDHSVAEHVPGDILSRDRARHGIPYTRFQEVREISRIVARTRNDQDFPVLHERCVYRVDRHRVR